MSKAPIWAVVPPGSRKPRFSRDQIAACALEIADREGFEALSMRRIAEKLGAGTMTLYHYVRTKDDLLALLDDALMGECVQRALPLPKHWRPAIAKLAHATRDTFVAHPWALQALQGARVGPNNLAHVEQSLAAVEDLACPMSTKLALLSLVDDYVFGHVLRANETAITPAPDAKTARLINEFTTELLREHDFPRIKKLIGSEEPIVVFRRYSEAMSTDERFEVGLEALLDGLERRYKLPPVPGKRSKVRP